MNAARLCLGKLKYDDVKNDTMNVLNWLFTDSMYAYRCYVFMHQFIYWQLPLYFYEQLDLCVGNGRNGLIINTNVLSKNKYGDKLIECSALKQFNALPYDLRNNSNLHLFKQEIINLLKKNVSNT